MYIIKLADGNVLKFSNLLCAVDSLLFHLPNANGRIVSDTNGEVWTVEMCRKIVNYARPHKREER